MVFMKYFFLFFVVVVKSIFAECCDCCKDCCPFFGKKDVNIVKKDLFVKKDVNILMLGLDGAGKTTILYKLKKEEPYNKRPTIGFNVEIIEHKNFNFNIYDVGGQDKIRVLWKHHYQNTDGLIFVVDANDRDRIDEAAEELKKLLEAEELKDCPVLVYANKEDLNGALGPGEVTEKLGMGQLKGRTWLVQGASATTGQGLKEGLDWMASALLKKK